MRQFNRRSIYIYITILIQDRCKFIVKMNKAKELLCHFIKQLDWMFINMWQCRFEGVEELEDVYHKGCF